MADPGTVVRRSKADWEIIRLEYESSTDSEREIAIRHGLSYTAIQKRRAKEGWSRGGINMAKRRLVAERLTTSTTDNSVVGDNRKKSSLEAAADQDAEVMRRVASAAEKSIRINLRLLGEAEAALDMAKEQDWKERAETIKNGDGEPNGSSTTTTTKTPGRLDLDFDAAKVVKISTEALQIARKVYAQARGLEDGSDGVNVNVSAQAGAVANAASMPLDVRLTEFRRAAAAAMIREPTPADATPTDGAS